MKTIPPAVSLLLILALGAAAVVQTMNVAQLKRQLAAAQQQAVVHEQQVKVEQAVTTRLREQNEAFKSESATLRQRLASIAPGSMPTPTQGAVVAEISSAASGENAPGKESEDKSADGGGAGGFMKNVAKMFTDPEMKKVMRAQQGMGVRMMYGDLAKELGLSVEETDAVMELLTDRQLETAAKSMEMMGGDGKIDTTKAEEMTKATNATREEFDSKLKEAVGPERFAKFQEYEKTVSDRFMVQQYGQQFAAYGTPLQDGQREGLMRILSEERQRSKMPDMFNPTSKDSAASMQMMQSDEAMHSFLASQEDYNTRVLSRATEVLTPEQLNSFKSIQNHWAQMMQMGMKMSKEMMK